MKRQATPLPTHFDEIVADARRNVKLAAAIGFLGLRWRGSALCTHRYTTSAGVEVREIWPEREV